MENLILNGIKPQGKLWTLVSGASSGELNQAFSSAVAEREGGLNVQAYPIGSCNQALV